VTPDLESEECAFKIVRPKRHRRSARQLALAGLASVAAAPVAVGVLQVIRRRTGSTRCAAR